MKSEESLNLNNNSIVKYLQNLYFSENQPQPSRLQPIDIAFVTYLLLRRTQDHEIFDSQFTIAQRLRSDRRAVARSLARLKAAGWFSVRKRGRAQTAAIALNIGSLPATRTLREKVTPEAGQLAFRYQRAVQRIRPRRFSKSWLSRQVVNAQIILGLCDGNLERAAAILTHGITKSRHQRKARISLYHARMVWPQIVESYLAAQQTQTGKEAEAA